ncbi:MAG: hypothetical protein NT154_40640 [Verrucomicrobia bacterium]|nr:hypothetical protein [Verrucomicrobiota bacterium]
MNTNLNSQIASVRSISGEGWAAIAGAIGSAFLLAKKLLGTKAAPKPEWVTRSDFYAEMLATRERINATHLAILEKLGANHRELLGALERQTSRINTLETGLARVDERTRK